MALFKKNWQNESGKSTIFRLAFKIFYAHIILIVLFVVVNLLMVSIDSIFKSELTSQTWFLVAINIICFVFYCIDVYIESWRTGARDLNLVNFKRIEYKPFKPLVAGFASQILGIIAAIFTLISGFAYSDLVRRFLSFFYLDFIYPISLANKGDASAVMYFIPVVFAPVICSLAYHLGYKEIRILDKLMYRKKAKEDK